MAKTVNLNIRIDPEVRKEADDPFWSETNQKILRESIAQLEKDGGTVHELIEVDDE